MVNIYFDRHSHRPAGKSAIKLTLNGSGCCLFIVWVFSPYVQSNGVRLELKLQAGCAERVCVGMCVNTVPSVGCRLYILVGINSD